MHAEVHQQSDALPLGIMLPGLKTNLDKILPIVKRLIINIAGIVRRNNELWSEDDKV